MFYVKIDAPEAIKQLIAKAMEKPENHKVLTVFTDEGVNYIPTDEPYEFQWEQTSLHREDILSWTVSTLLDVMEAAEGQTFVEAYREQVRHHIDDTLLNPFDREDLWFTEAEYTQVVQDASGRYGISVLTFVHVNDLAAYRG